MKPGTRYRVALLTNDPILLVLLAGGVLFLNISFFGTGVLEASELALSAYRKAILFWSSLQNVMGLIIPITAMYLGLRLLGPELGGGQWYVELSCAKSRIALFWRHVVPALVILVSFVAALIVDAYALGRVSKMPDDFANLWTFFSGYCTQGAVYFSVGLLSSVVFWGWGGLASCLAFFVMASIVVDGVVPFLNLSLMLPKWINRPLHFAFPAMGQYLNLSDPDAIVTGSMPLFFRMGLHHHWYQLAWAAMVGSIAALAASRKDY